MRTASNNFRGMSIEQVLHVKATTSSDDDKHIEDANRLLACILQYSLVPSRKIYATLYPVQVVIRLILLPTGLIFTRPQSITMSARALRATGSSIRAASNPILRHTELRRCFTTTIQRPVSASGLPSDVEASSHAKKTAPLSPEMQKFLDSAVSLTLCIGFVRPC